MNIIFLSSIQDMYIEFPDLDFQLVIAIYFWEKKLILFIYENASLPTVIILTNGTNIDNSFSFQTLRTF